MPSNEEIEFALNEHRLIVLLENEEGKFNQVMLNAEQFKKVSDACIAHTKENATEGMREGMEMVYMHINEDVALDADLFLGCSSVVSHEEEIENCNECEIG